jgi:2-polyprenyl-3-methyl-5-hydroxy-6-metoxy-1,4-benzoquinol methylase
MLPTADVIRADFDRIAACSRDLTEDERDALEPAASRLIAEVPLRSRVLEIGCGAGAFARELATKRGARVTAIDLSPRMIDVARVRTPDSFGIEYRVADFMALSPRGFDVVVAVNTLHHLPLADAGARLASAVVPGGNVLVSDLFAARGLVELPYNGISWLLRSRGHRPSPALAAAWAAHGKHDDLQPIGEVRWLLGTAMPGISVRRHLGWRYTAIWQRSK